MPTDSEQTPILSTDSLKTGQKTEWKTLGLALTIYGSWIAILVALATIPDRFPLWLGVGLLAVIITWHGSLQHEVSHDHPFSSLHLNRLLATPPLGMRVPFPVYRRGHLDHHRAIELTGPTQDTESYYYGQQRWSTYPAMFQKVLLFHHTLVGRLLLGPLWETPRVWLRELGSVRSGDKRLALWWTEFLVECTLIFSFVVGVLGLPWWLYPAAGYLGHSLGLVRSFAEHRWTPAEQTRSAVVRAGRFFSLLFLHNNLHHAHHARPNDAWYLLPKLAGELNSDQAARAGAGLYSGYWNVARRFGFRPQDHPLYPPQRT